MEKEMFLAYEVVRRSGQTNMFDVNTVIMLMEDEGVYPEKSDVMDIMKNYSAYSDKWLTN